METRNLSPPPYFAASTGLYGDPDTTSSPPKYESLSPENLALTRNWFSTPRVFVSGGSRTPDLTISTSDGLKLYQLQTDSTLVYHETYVKDLRGSQNLFIIRRYPVQDMPDGTWRYTINVSTGRRGAHKTGGTKILEIDTDPSMVLAGDKTSWETRLIFRNAMTSELDGLTLRMTKNSTRRDVGGEVLYQGKKVADILDRGGKEPGFELRIFRDSLDPLLVVMMAYVMDDRVMGSKRRNRRGASVGLLGIGKGPGAGLAGAYGLSTVI